MSIGSTKHICEKTFRLKIVASYVIIGGILIISNNIYFCYKFIIKLKSLYGNLDCQTTQNGQMIKCVKRHALLTIISVISIFVALGLTAFNPYKFTFIQQIDCVVNGYCLIGFFKFSDKWYYGICGKIENVLFLLCFRNDRVRRVNGNETINSDIV